MNILRKKAQKVKKHNNFTFHDYLPQCRSQNRNYSQATKLFKPIMKNRTFNDKR